jgi:hypothetical protein
MRSVAKAVKLTVRLTRLLPVTVPNVTHAEPFQPSTLKSVVPQVPKVIVSVGSTGLERLSCSV